jgi:hypothetical protein
MSKQEMGMTPVLELEIVEVQPEPSDPVSQGRPPKKKKPSLPNTEEQ